MSPVWPVAWKLNLTTACAPLPLPPVALVGRAPGRASARAPAARRVSCGARMGVGLGVHRSALLHRINVYLVASRTHGPPVQPRCSDVWRHLRQGRLGVVGFSLFFAICTHPQPDPPLSPSQPLDCGLHKCSRRCHFGDCGECHQVVDKKCQCGATKKSTVCGQPLVCDKRCNRTRSCGRHTCRRKCCDGNCPPCPEVRRRMRPAPSLPCNRRSARAILTLFSPSRSAADASTAKITSAPVRATTGHATFVPSVRRSPVPAARRPCPCRAGESTARGRPAAASPAASRRTATTRRKCRTRATTATVPSVRRGRLVRGRTQGGRR